MIAGESVEDVGQRRRVPDSGGAAQAGDGVPGGHADRGAVQAQAAAAQVGDLREDGEDAEGGHGPGEGAGAEGAGAGRRHVQRILTRTVVVWIDVCVYFDSGVMVLQVKSVLCVWREREREKIK